MASASEPVSDLTCAASALIYTPEAEVFDHPSDRALYEDLVPVVTEEATTTSRGPRTNIADSRADQVAGCVPLCWWRRPSPWWLMIPYAITSGSEIAILPTRVQLLTTLVCAAIKSGLGTSKNAWTSPSQCNTDPAVQAGVAKVEGTLLTIVGFLSVLTVAWWGSLSDRYGRTRIIGIGFLGLAFDDSVVILVSKYAQLFPGGYWFLLIGSVLSGVLGGVVAVLVAMNAYIADCSAPDQRSRFFGLFMAAGYVGTFAGPTIGGLLNKWTGVPLVTYYIALSVHLSMAMFTVAIIPESLSVTMRTTARRASLRTDPSQRGTFKLSDLARRLATQAGAFINPLRIFLPTRRKSGSNLGKSTRWDWNLTLVAASINCVALINGGVMYKLQYMLLRFSWSPDQLSFWLTALGISRAVYLGLILPAITHLFKPKQCSSQAPVGSEERLTVSAIAPSPSVKSYRHAILRFDFRLAFVSLLLYAIAYVGITLAPTGYLFTVASVFTSLGGGFGPTSQSMLLELHSLRVGTHDAQAGAVLGSLGVLAALVGQVLGPAMLGIVYFKTVARLPQTIFIVCAAFLILGTVFLSLVRLPQDEEDGSEEDFAAVSHMEGPTLVSQSNMIEDSTINTPTEQTPLLA